jgi:hypothetical protein
MDQGRLVIDPEPKPRNPADDPDTEWPYATIAVDLRLGDEVSWFKEGLAINLDLRRGTRGRQKLIGEMRVVGALHSTYDSFGF